MRWYIIQTHYPRFENVHSMPAEHGMPTSIIGWCRKSVLGYTSTPDFRILDLLEKHVLGDRRCCRHRLNLCSKRYSTIGRHDEMIVERKTKLYTRKICARGSARRRTHHVKFVLVYIARFACNTSSHWREQLVASWTSYLHQSRHDRIPHTNRTFTMRATKVTSFAASIGTMPLVNGASCWKARNSSWRWCRSGPSESHCP